MRTSASSVLQQPQSKTDGALRQSSEATATAKATETTVNIPNNTKTAAPDTKNSDAVTDPKKSENTISADHEDASCWDTGPLLCEMCFENVNARARQVRPLPYYWMNNQSFILMMLANDFVIAAGLIVLGVLFIVYYAQDALESETVRGSASLTAYLLIGVGVYVMTQFVLLFFLKLAEVQVVLRYAFALLFMLFGAYALLVVVIYGRLPNGGVSAVESRVSGFSDALKVKIAQNFVIYIVCASILAVYAFLHAYWTYLIVRVVFIERDAALKVSPESVHSSEQINEGNISEVQGLANNNNGNDVSSNNAANDPAEEKTAVRQSEKTKRPEDGEQENAPQEKKRADAPQRKSKQVSPLDERPSATVEGDRDKSINRGEEDTKSRLDESKIDNQAPVDVQDVENIPDNQGGDQDQDAEQQQQQQQKPFSVYPYTKTRALQRKRRDRNIEQGWDNQIVKDEDTGAIFKLILPCPTGTYNR